MFVGSNLAEGIQSPQAQQVAETRQSNHPEEYCEVMIYDVINAACSRPRGLILHLGTRGHRRVSENVTFKKGDLTSVQVRPDFSFVLTFRDQRYWVQSKKENCEAIQRIQTHLRDPDEFDFPETISFSTGS